MLCTPLYCPLYVCVCLIMRFHISINNNWLFIYLVKRGRERETDLVILPILRRLSVIEKKQNITSSFVFSWGNQEVRQWVMHRITTLLQLQQQRQRILRIMLQQIQFTQISIVSDLTINWFKTFRYKSWQLFFIFDHNRFHICNDHNRSSFENISVENVFEKKMKSKEIIENSVFLFSSVVSPRQTC